MISHGLKTTRRIYHPLFRLLSTTTWTRPIKTPTLSLPSSYLNFSNFNLRLHSRYRTHDTSSPLGTQVQVQETAKQKRRRPSSIHIAQTVVVVVIVLVVSAGVYAWHYRNVEMERRRKRRVRTFVRDGESLVVYWWGCCGCGAEYEWCWSRSWIWVFGRKMCLRVLKGASVGLFCAVD